MMIDPIERKRRNTAQDVYVRPLPKRKYRVAFGFAQWFTIKGRTFRIDIEEGYITDLASIPRFLWSLYPPDGLYRAAAIIHDLLFQICGPRGEDRPIELWEIQEDGSAVKVKLKLTKKECNIVFKQIMKDWDVGWWTRGTFYNAVQVYPLAW